MLSEACYHILNSSSFQDLITDLFNAKYNSNSYIQLGRSGQKQHGIDVFSNQDSTVIQCKHRNNLNSVSSIVKDLKKELKEDVKKAAQSDIAFNHFILVSTYRHDAELQHYAIELRDQFKYSFNISYIGWDEIIKWLIQLPEIYMRYFKHFDLPFIPIELFSVAIDSNNCSWESISDNENTFYRDQSSDKPESPILDFSFINHLDRTIVLKSVRLWVKSLYSGFSGVPKPTLLESSTTYCMSFQYRKENILKTIPPLEIPKEQAFRFKLQIANEYGGVTYSIKGRNILYFDFEFSSNVKVTAPKIYLNTKNEFNSVTLSILS